jgi:hypothetical protein
MLKFFQLIAMYLTIMMTALLIVRVFAFLSVGADGSGCTPQSDQPQSASGIRKASVLVPTDPDGHSIEQKNIMARLLIDNKPGSIKHLYVISAYSGQVLIYSTVKGKVTSSGKRLTPNTVSTHNPSNNSYDGIPVDIGGMNLRTGEVLQDDGTYGSSIDYIYWTDVRGVYHQHYPAGGQIIHVSDQPISVKDVVLNMEMRNSDK